MRIFSYLLIIIVIIIGISFASLNADSVIFNYYVGKISIPLSLLLLVFFITGSIFTLLFNLLIFIKSKRKISSLKKQLSITEKEIRNLRQLPINDQP